MIRRPTETRAGRRPWARMRDSGIGNGRARMCLGGDSSDTDGEFVEGMESVADDILEFEIDDLAEMDDEGSSAPHCSRISFASCEENRNRLSFQESGSRLTFGCGTFGRPSFGSASGNPEPTAVFKRFSFHGAGVGHGLDAMSQAGTGNLGFEPPDRGGSLGGRSSFGDLDPSAEAGMLLFSEGTSGSMPSDAFVSSQFSSRREPESEAYAGEDVGARNYRKFFARNNYVPPSSSTESNHVDEHLNCDLQADLQAFYVSRDRDSVREPDEEPDEEPEAKPIEAMSPSKTPRMPTTTEQQALKEQQDCTVVLASSKSLLRVLASSGCLPHASDFEDAVNVDGIPQENLSLCPSCKNSDFHSSMNSDVGSDHQSMPSESSRSVGACSAPDEHTQPLAYNIASHGSRPNSSQLPSLLQSRSQAHKNETVHHHHTPCAPTSPLRRTQSQQLRMCQYRANGWLGGKSEKKNEVKNNILQKGDDEFRGTDPHELNSANLQRAMEAAEQQRIEMEASEKQKQRKANALFDLMDQANILKFKSHDSEDASLCYSSEHSEIDDLFL